MVRTVNRASFVAVLAAFAALTAGEFGADSVDPATAFFFLLAAFLAWAFTVR